MVERGIAAIKYCNCALCGHAIRALFDRTGKRLNSPPTRVKGRPLCDACVGDWQVGDKAPTYEHTLKLKIVLC